MPAASMSAGLEPYGYTDAVAAEFVALELGADAEVGRVGRVDRGECDVFGAKGPIRVFSDSQRSQNVLAPATGDWVAVVEDSDLGPLIEAILPRRTAIVRRDPSEQVIEQVLVANVDVVAVVHGLDREVNPARLERFLVLAWDSGAEPVIVLTKADLAADAAAIDAAVELATVAPDVAVLVTSAPTGQGLSELRDLLVGGRTLVMVGPSGVGKSHLVNALVGDEVQAIGAVRSSDSKGRHTTTTRDLIPVPGGGVLIDTPGIRAVGVWAADYALDRVYQDVVAVAAECRFRDCTHRQEPNCAVRGAVKAGGLDPARVERYLRMWDEIANQSVEAEERARKQSQGRSRGGRRGRR